MKTHFDYPAIAVGVTTPTAGRLRVGTSATARRRGSGSLPHTAPVVRPGCCCFFFEFFLSFFFFSFTAGWAQAACNHRDRERERERGTWPEFGRAARGGGGGGGGIHRN